MELDDRHVSLVERISRDVQPTSSHIFLRRSGFEVNIAVSISPSSADINVARIMYNVEARSKV